MPMPPTIDPVACTRMDSQFNDPLAHRLCIPNIPAFDLMQSHINPGPCGLVSERGQPLAERIMPIVLLVMDDLVHLESVA